MPTLLVHPIRDRIRTERVLAKALHQRGVPLVGIQAGAALGTALLADACVVILFRLLT